MSKSSRTSLRNYGKQGTKKKREAHKSLLKPYNFCCNINDQDYETRYDERRPPFSSSLTVLTPIQESPTIKFRYEKIEAVTNAKRKTIKNKSKPKDWDLDSNPCVKTRGPLLWFLEDEIELAKDNFWSQKQKIYNAEADRNALIGEKKVKKRLGSSMNASGPRWYQDLSIPQMKQVLSLGETMTADYEETITIRTQKALAVIGVTSTLFKIAPQDIKMLQRSTRLEPVQFLREIYRRVTGQYFEEEEYKKTYDCNERIILSAIAFLALPDTVIELNNRLPQISEPVFPPKPKPPQTLSTNHGRYKWPYEEPLPQPPDWVTYRKSLDEWREKCKLIPRPRIILPQLKGNTMKDIRDFKEMTAKVVDKGITTNGKTNSPDFHNSQKGEQSETKMNGNEDDSLANLKMPFDLSIPTLPGGDKQTFEFSISGLGEKPGPVNYKICGTLKPPFPKRKSWLGEKEAHYIVSGISEHEDPPQCPVTYVMTGISYVTPDNSDEQFFTELKLGDCPKRFYPAGRNSLSKNWQEWLQDADEEFLEVEKEANKLIKSVEATMRLVIPGHRCDACCSCRQTRKANLKAHATKTPYMVIDSIAESDNQNRYIVGSLAMHSPAPSPAESTVNLLEVVASKETIQKKLVINGITNDSGETTYYISGVTEETEYTPQTTAFKERPPKPLRNVPPCACTIEQMFNECKTPSVSSDDIPQTKKKGICCGRKYRPKESPAFTCKEYPDDKSCRRNPFRNKIKRGIFPKTNDRNDDENDGVPKEKKMFTLPAFSPCGDEDGMAVCGGPWGAKNIPSPEIIAAREAEAKKGARNLPSKVGKAGEEDEEEENEEEEEEGDERKLSPRELAKMAKEAEAEERKLRRQQLKRDGLCSEKFQDEFTNADQSPIAEEPVYCDFDNPWNKTRTAPTSNPWENEYEKSLRLTEPVVPSDDHKDGHNRTGNASRQKRKQDGLNSSDGNSTVKEGRDKTKNNHERTSKSANNNVQVIYSNKQAAKDPNSTSSQQSDPKPGGLAKETVRKNFLTSDKELKGAAMENSKSHKTSRNEKGGRKNEDKTPRTAKKPNTKTKSDHKSDQGNGSRNKPSIQDDCANYKDRELSRKGTRIKKSHGPNQDDVKHKRNKTKAPSPSSARQAQVSPKKANASKEYKVMRAVIPDAPRLPCQRENTYSDKEPDNCECSDQKGIGSDSHSGRDGPKFGWRTKSQQELPREKTLVYLAEPNDPVEMIKMREGGRPCTCRENRNNKKILIYNIGGAVNVGKNGKGSSKCPQVIEGVTYVTPPQSPRNSSEYIPEYELFESPYKMCERKRSDKDLKYISEISTIRSLSPQRKPNVESCPCGDELEANGDENLSAKKVSTSRENRWSSALKDEGLIDYFVSCQDAVPCWLKCAKFSKAGCCEKPRLLQVKKPVCECRYERRVVRREGEKQKWVDRQRRLKTAKKQPYLQVAGTSRPMTQDTKLIISSVKKVLRDGEFIPETQYCVTGIAENYAMGPPHYVTPGITMQSPVVTPEPSKPDILCMCGHRHWSPTDVTTGNAPEITSVRAKGEYPCRGREQGKELTEKIIPNDEETMGADDSEPYVAYHSCADAVESCHTIFDKKRHLEGGKKRKLVSGRRKMGDNANGNSKKLKFNTEKESRDSNVKRKNGSTDEGGGGMKVSEVKSEAFKSSEKQREHYEHETSSKKNKTSEDNRVARDDSLQSKSTPESESDLFELMKIELEKMASEDFVLAKLPECWLIPQLRSWIDYQEGKVYTDAFKKKLCHMTEKHWDMMQQTRKPSVPLPSLNLTKAEVAQMTFDRANEMKRKIPALQAQYFSEIRKMRVSEARLYWPTMEFGKFPSLSFKEAYFTYMAGKEADGHVFRPWKISDSER